MAMHDYKLKYRDFEIHIKQDFGTGFHLVDGMPCNFGYVICYTKESPFMTEYAGCNACPGAGWFHTVEEAKVAIDILVAIGGEKNSNLFHKAWRRYMDLKKVAAITVRDELFFNGDSNE